MNEPRPSELEKELATPERLREEEEMRGSSHANTDDGAADEQPIPEPYPPPDEGDPPTPAVVPEPYPPDETEPPRLPPDDPDQSDRR